MLGGQSSPQSKCPSTTTLLGTKSASSLSHIFSASPEATSYGMIGPFLSTFPEIAFAYGSTSSLFALNRSPFSGSHGPFTRYPYRCPGPIPRSNPCHTNAVRSFNSTQSVCFPASSNRHTCTPVAYSENTAKFVPSWEGVAPSG